jgi:hypothetical protein
VGEKKKSGQKIGIKKSKKQKGKKKKKNEFETYHCNQDKNDEHHYTIARGG